MTHKQIEEFIVFKGGVLDEEKEEFTETPPEIVRMDWFTALAKAPIISKDGQFNLVGWKRMPILLYQRTQESETINGIAHTIYKYVGSEPIVSAPEESKED